MAGLTSELFPHEVVTCYPHDEHLMRLRHAMQFVDFVHSMFGVECAFVLDRQRYSEDGKALFYWTFQDANQALVVKLAWPG